MRLLLPLGSAWSVEFVEFSGLVGAISAQVEGLSKRYKLRNSWATSARNKPVEQKKSCTDSQVSERVWKEKKQELDTFLSQTWKTNLDRMVTPTGPDVAQARLRHRFKFNARKHYLHGFPKFWRNVDRQVARSLLGSSHLSGTGCQVPASSQIPTLLYRPAPLPFIHAKRKNSGSRASKFLLFKVTSS